MGEQTYQAASAAFNRGDYSQALSRYRAYLAQFPGGRHTDDALLKMGIILTEQRNFAEARSLFDRLIVEHPPSPLAAEAKIQRIRTYYLAGQSQAVVEEAAAIDDELLPVDSRAMLYRLRADAYADRGMLPDAAYNYALAHGLTGVGDQKDALATRARAVIDRMPPGELDLLAERLDDIFPKDYLLYRLSLKHLEAERYAEAWSVLEQYTTLFPDGDEAAWAREKLAEISSRLLIDPQTLGCLLPLSGPYKRYGLRAMKGVELALYRFNSQGDNPPVSIMIRDTGSETQQTFGAVKELAAARVAAIIGPMVTAEAAAFEAQEIGIPIVVLSQKDVITDIGDYVFRNFITPQMQVRALVAFTMEELGISRFAVLYPREKYGTTFINLFWDQVLAAGGSIVGAESYDLDQTDFVDPIKKLVGLFYEVPADLRPVEEPEPGVDPEAAANQEETEEEEPIVDFGALFIPDSPQKAGLIIPQLAFHDVKGMTLLGTNLWHSRSLIEMSRQFVQGAVIPENFFPKSSAVAVVDFVTAYQNAYGEVPGYIEAVAYDTTMILLQTLTRDKIQLGTELRDALLSLRNYEGATGLTSFNESGDADKSLYLLTIQGNDFVEITPRFSTTPAR